MRRAAGLLGLDPALYRVDGISDEGACHTATVRRVAGERECPGCGRRANVHGSKSVTVYHAPLMGKPTVLTLVRTRLRCPACGKTFWEEEPLLSGLSPHLSAACAAWALARLAGGATVAALERECGASRNILRKVEGTAGQPARRLPEHLCIDEVRAFPRRVAAKRRAPHMAACLYDAENRTLVDMFEGAEADDVERGLGRFGTMGRRRVKTVSCDLNGDYIALVERLFPDALVYADKFHVAKLVTGAVDEGRKALRQHVLTRHANKEIGEAECKSLKKLIARATRPLLTREASLGERHREIVAEALALEGAAGLRAAWLLEQMFFEWSDARYGSRDEMAAALERWVARARDRRAPKEMRTAAYTIRRRKEYVLNAWQTGRTNAVAEGLNRVIKDVIRDCRGFNSFEALRRRCLIRLGSPREAGGPIPLFERGGRKEAEKD